MLPDLDSLSLFVLAAERRSLTKAADAACLSLAAASRRIGLLESSFKTRLLERTPRGVILTPAGTALLAHAKRVLLEVNHLQSDMTDHANGSKGLVRLLATTSAVTSYLPSDLAGFSERYPEVRLSLGEGWSEEIVRSIRDHKADVGIVVKGSQPIALETQHYRSYHIAVVLQRGHPLTRTAAVSFVDVLPFEVVALESTSLMMRSLFEQALLVQRPLRVKVQVRSFEAVCRLVQSGLGVGLLPLEATTGLVDSGMGLTVLALTDAWARREMVVCYRPESDRSRSLVSLIDHLANCEAVPPASLRVSTD